MPTVAGGYAEWAAAGKPSSGAPERTSPAFEKIAAKSTKKNRRTGKSPQDTAIEHFLEGVQKRAQEYFNKAVKVQAARETKEAERKAKEEEQHRKESATDYKQASAQQSKQYEALAEGLTKAYYSGTLPENQKLPAGAIEGKPRAGVYKRRGGDVGRWEFRPDETLAHDDDDGGFFGLAKKVGGTALTVLQAPQAAVTATAGATLDVGTKAAFGIAGAIKGGGAEVGARAYENVREATGGEMPGFRGTPTPARIWEDIKSSKTPSQAFLEPTEQLAARQGVSLGPLDNPFVRVGTHLAVDIPTDPIVYLAPEAGLARLGKAGVAVKAAEEAAVASRAARGLREGLLVPEIGEEAVTVARRASQTVREADALGRDLRSAENLVRAGKATAADLKPSEAAVKAAAQLEERANRFRYLTMKAGKGRLGAGLTRAELQEVTGKIGGVHLTVPGTGPIGRRLGVAKLLTKGENLARHEALQAPLLGRTALTAAPGRFLGSISKSASKTKLFETLANSLGGAEPELRKITRQTKDPEKYADALLGIRAKRMGRLKQAGGERDLKDLFTTALKPVHKKVDDTTLIAAWRGDQAARARAVAAVGEEAANKAIGVWGEALRFINSHAGFSMIAERANYAPRIVKTTEGDTILPEFGRVFNKAGIEKQAVKPGDTFLGKLIEDPSLGKTVEQQMEDAIKSTGEITTELSDNVGEMVQKWMNSATRRLGEEHARDLMMRWDVAHDGVGWIGNPRRKKLVAQRNSAEAVIAGLRVREAGLRKAYEDLTGVTASKGFTAKAGEAEGLRQVAQREVENIRTLIDATKARIGQTREAVEEHSRILAMAQASAEDLRYQIDDLTARREMLLGQTLTSDVAAAGVTKELDAALEQATKNYQELISNPIVVEGNMQAVVAGEKELALVRAALANGDDDVIRRLVDSLPDRTRIDYGTMNPRLTLSRHADALDAGIHDATVQLRATGSPVPSQMEAENLRKYLPRLRENVEKQAVLVDSLDPADPAIHDAIRTLAQAQQDSHRAHLAMEMYDMVHRRLGADDVLAQDRIVKALATGEGVGELMGMRREVLQNLIQDPEHYVNGDLKDVTRVFDQAWLSFHPKTFDAFIDAVGAPATTVAHLEDAKAFAARFNVDLSEAFDAALMRGPAGGDIDLGAYRHMKETLGEALGVPAEDLPPLFAGQVIREMFGEKPLLLQVRDLERELGFRMSRVSQQMDRLVDAHADAALAESQLQGLLTGNLASEGVVKQLEAAKWSDLARKYRTAERQALVTGVTDLTHPNHLAMAAEQAELSAKLAQTSRDIKGQNKLLSDAIDGLGKPGAQSEGAFRLLHEDGMKNFGAIYWNGRDPMRATLADPQMADALAQSTKMVGANSEFLRYWNGVTQWWKRFAILYPGFTIRNVFGGVYNNWLAGVSHGAWHDFSRADRAFGGGAEKWAKFADKDPQLARAYTLWKDAGGISGGQTAYEIAGQHLFPGFMQRANPLSQDFLPVQGARKFNTWAEDHIRGSQAVDSIMKEWDNALGDFAPGALQRAVDRVDKYQFDYGDLSAFEQGVMRRMLVPFYTWSRKNLPLQFEMFVTNPSKATRYFKIKNEIERESTPDATVPSYLADMFSIRLPISTNDKAGHVYYLPDLPMKTAFQAPDWKYWFGAVNPLIKMPIEAYAGEQIQTGVPIKDTFSVAPQVWEKIPGLMPLMAKFDQARMGKDGAWYVTGKGAYVVEQLLPVAGRMRRLLPSEKKYQERGWTSWLSFLGVSLRANTKFEQDITKAVQESQARDAKSAQKRLPEALKP